MARCTLPPTFRPYPKEAEIISASDAMRGVFELVERVADAPAPVLVLGETGTGKTLVAERIHLRSRRAAAPFVAVNCAALPAELLESELFGHVRGAFTGAHAARAGLFAEARGGTILLDEIGEMSPPLQAKLLHVVERRRARPVGGSSENDVDVRIIAATHRDLSACVRAGTFREDLLFRLDVLSVELAPLRRRPEDIPPLCDHFFREGFTRYPSAVTKSLSREALEVLMQWPWPGNVRELAHVIERLLLLGRSEVASREDVAMALGASVMLGASSFSGAVVPMREMQRRYAVWAYEELGCNRTRAARELGIDFKTLGRWLREPPFLGEMGEMGEGPGLNSRPPLRARRP